MSTQNLSKTSADLIKELRSDLGSITIEEILELDEVQLTDEQLTARASEAELFYIHWGEKLLKAIAYQQLVKLGEEAVNDIQTQFNRGKLDGIYLIEQWFKEQLSISRARFNPEEETKI